WTASATAAGSCKSSATSSRGVAADAAGGGGSTATTSRGDRDGSENGGRHRQRVVPPSYQLRDGPRNRPVCRKEPRTHRRVRTGRRRAGSCRRGTAGGKPPTPA